MKIPSVSLPYLYIVPALVLALLAFFDMALVVGLLLVALLSATTIFAMMAAGPKERQWYIVFLLAMAAHALVALFIYYAHFQPFGGGGDFTLYHQTAAEIANRFSHGIFSFNGLYTEHFFPIVIGVLYWLTLPNMLVGQLFVAWLAGVSVALVYLLSRTVGATKKIAFWTSIAVIGYPSYLYFGSTLLKDTVAIPLALAGVLLIIYMAQCFSWQKFALFFIVLAALTNLRFYVGYALLFSCIISWPFIAKGFGGRKTYIHWLVIIFLLGFSPMVVGNGYMGFSSFEKYLNPGQITYFRQVVYATPVKAILPNLPNQVAVIRPPSDGTPLTIAAPNNQSPGTDATVVPVPPVTEENSEGGGSNFTVDTGFSSGPFKFIKNSFLSFTFSLLGPFPWQIKYKRQAVSFIETIPWYLLIVVAVYRCIILAKKRGMAWFLRQYRMLLPLVVFGILALEALSLFINNYGIIARIRMPMVICFVIAMGMSFNASINDQS